MPRLARSRSARAAASVMLAVNTELARVVVTYMTVVPVGFSLLPLLPGVSDHVWRSIVARNR